MKRVCLLTDDPSCLEEFRQLIAKDFGSDVSLRWLSPGELSLDTDAIHDFFVIVDLDGPLIGGGSEDIKKVREIFKETPVIGTGKDFEVEQVLELLKEGVHDFLKRPFEALELQKVIQKIEKQRSAAAELSGHQSRMMTFCSPKGGTGVTLIAANLAVQLAERMHAKICLVDLSTGCGDVATYLNLAPKYTLRDLIENYESVDREYLESLMVQHPSGIHVLAGARGDQEPVMSGHVVEVQTCLKIIREIYDYVIVDVGHSEAGLIPMAIQDSDLVFLTGTLDVPTLRGMVCYYNQIKKYHLDPEKIKVIINRADAKNQANILKEFESAVHAQAAFQLPNNFALCIRAVNLGKPIAEVQNRSDLCRKIDEIAVWILEAFDESPPEEAVPPPKTKGVLRCLF